MAIRPLQVSGLSHQGHQKRQGPLPDSPFSTA